MKRIINFVTIILTYFYFASNSYASNNFNPSIMPQLEASNSQAEFQMARAYWLPDYTYGTATISDNGNNAPDNSCSYYGQMTSIPLNETCTKTTPAIGLTCYRDCYCSDKYQYHTCPSGKMLSTNCCNGRCISCDECTTTGNWSYTKPDVEKSRIKTTAQACGDVFFACELGFKPMDNSILGDIGNLKTCPEYQELTISTDGENCAKCSNKSCSKFGYHDKETSTGICTVINPYAGKSCYSCKECGSEYKYDASNCPAPNTLSGSNCGGRYTECTIVETCSPLANQTNCSAGTYSCSDGCDGTRTCCVNCEQDQKALLATINSGKKGVITVEHDITFCKNVGIVLKDGQSLTGKNGLKQKLTFDFNSSEKAIGIDLGNDSNLSDLIIDYTSVNKLDHDNFHAIRNNQKSNVTLTNLNITTQTNNKNYNTMAGISNLGDMELLGNINIHTAGTNAHGINGETYKSDIIGNLTQNKNCTVNIKTTGEQGYGIHKGRNTIHGTVNIETHGISASGTYNGDNYITGKLNIQTFGKYSSGLFGEKNSFTTSAKALIQIAHLNTPSIKGRFNYVKGFTIGTKTNTSTNYVNGVWKANNNAQMGGNLYSLHDKIYFDTIGEFPDLPLLP